MNPVINSNASSALVSILDGTDSNKNPFEYSYGKNDKGKSMASMSKTWNEITTTSSIALNSSIDFHIPKQGLLKQVVFKMTLGKDAADLVNNSIGMLQISRIELISAGRVVATQTAEALSCLASSQPYQSRKGVEDLLNCQAGAAASNMSSGTSFVCYVPFMASSFESLEKVYNTQFVESLVLRVYTASASAYTTASDGSTANSVTLDGLTCFCQYVNLPQEAEKKMIEKDYGSDNLSRVQWSTLHEYSAVTLSASADTTVQHEIKSNNVIQELYVYVDSGYDTTARALDENGRGLPVDNIKLEANGQSLLGNLDGKLAGLYG